MFDIGFSELLVIGVLGLLVLGPEKLPGAARTLGLLVGRVRRTMNNFQDELERQVRAEELREKLKDPYATFISNEPVSGLNPAAKEESGNGSSQPVSAIAAIPQPAEVDTSATANTIQPTNSLATPTDNTAMTPSVNPVSATPTPRQQDNQPVS